MKKYYVLGKQKTNTTAVCIFMNNEGKYFIEEAVTTKVGICNFITKALKQMPTNETIAPEMSTIYAADVIGKAVTNGTIGNWIRDKKAGTGNLLTEEEISATREMYIELGKRNLNVRVLPTSALSNKHNEDTDSKNAIKRCWAMLDRHQVNMGYTMQPQVNPNQAAIDAITQQIVQAATSGNMELLAQLNVALQTLQGVSAPVQAAPVESDINFDAKPHSIDIDLNQNQAQVTQQEEPVNESLFDELSQMNEQTV